MQAKVLQNSPKGEHSTILLTSIKLPFGIKIFVLSIFKWPFFTGFPVPLSRTYCHGPNGVRATEARPNWCLKRVCNSARTGFPEIKYTYIMLFQGKLITFRLLMNHVNQTADDCWFCFPNIMSCVFQSQGYARMKHHHLFQSLGL